MNYNRLELELDEHKNLTTNYNRLELELDEL